MDTHPDGAVTHAPQTLDHATRFSEVQRILATNRYLTLGTATPGGSPWVTPVYFAHEDPTVLWWVSAPDARHSRNLLTNPAVAVVVFDSTVPIGGAAAVYGEAWAGECADDAVAEGIELFSRCSRRDGSAAWDASAVTGPAGHRLYLARLSSLFLLAGDGGPDGRIPVPLPRPPQRPRPQNH